MSNIYSLYMTRYEVEVQGHLVLRTAFAFSLQKCFLEGKLFFANFLSEVRLQLNFFQVKEWSHK